MSSISSSTAAPPSPSSTVASADDPSLSSEVDVLRGSVIKYVKGKIEDLKEKKVEFGKNADVAAHNIRAEFEIILSWMYKMEDEIESHLNQVRNVRMRDIDERIQLISSELLPSLVVTPDGSVSEADIRLCNHSPKNLSAYVHFLVFPLSRYMYFVLSSFRNDIYHSAVQ